MIDSKEISVVVQGAVNKEETPKCLKSVREYLPNAEIILSTWVGSDVEFLNGLYDVVIFNEDPGCGYYFKTETKCKCNNLNRQLVSTQNGLKKASRTYAMKIRSDIILSSDKFLRYLDYYPARDKEYSLFRQKILTSCVCSRYSYNDYDGKNRFDERMIAFHVSDWWFLGLREDLIKYFDVPLTKEPEFSNYYKNEENMNKFNPYFIYDEYVQFAPEQYIAISCFKKYFPNIKMEHAGDMSEELKEQSHKFLINNFIFLEYSNSGIFLNKYLISKYSCFSTVYTDLYNKYRQEYEYKKYCDSTYKISNLTKYIIENKNYQTDRRNLLIHFLRVKHRNKNMLKEILQTFFYAIVITVKNIRMIGLYIDYYNNYEKG